MTSQAVVLLVAGDTTLQVLPGCLGVAEDPDRLVVVEGGNQVTFTLKARPKVTFPTECLGIVAGCAVTDPAIGLRPV